MTAYRLYITEQSESDAHPTEVVTIAILDDLWPTHDACVTLQHAEDNLAKFRRGNDTAEMVWRTIMVTEWVTASARQWCGGCDR